jgi:hypothetical protein
MQVPEATPSSSPSTSQTKSTVTPIPSTPPRYVTGDVVITSPYDAIGKVVLSYDSSKSQYSVRSVIIDEFGKILYFDTDSSQALSRSDLENNYPVKVGNLDNPYNLAIFKPAHKPKYKNGDIVTEAKYPLEGVLILSYDYFNDIYTYTTAYASDGKWDYDTTAKERKERSKIEAKYTKKATSVKI